ncbi:MAG: SDR family NAD(P)-dependent oxidoreductase [Lachnospiraceae bacterium]|nr:SDR family NAD(P)-dependent oxidoreductase [Lachnospiraceae bacterium]
MNIAIVTGASSGMGAECVRQLNKAYTKLDEIWIIARRLDRLREVADCKGNALIRPIAMDITNDAHVDALIDAFREVKPHIRMLVNAAGNGVIGRFDDESYDDELSMIDLNCRALTAFTKICLPYMEKNSRIINFASAAAFLPQPEFAVYAATKSYVLSFSRALRKELKGRGIAVTAVCPGPVATEFFEIAEKHHSIAAYKKLAMVRPAAVVEKALKDSRAKREVSVYSAAMNIFRFFTKVLPHSLFLYFWKEA